MSADLLTREEIEGCPFGDVLCPCQDGDLCHYEGEDPWPLKAAHVAYVRSVQRTALAALDRVRELEGETASAYSERNRLVAYLASCFPAVLERHPEEEEWEDDWRWIVFIHHPNGQLSWHIHDSELPLFGHVPRGIGNVTWDGHTTEEKYERLARGR